MLNPNEKIDSWDAGMSTKKIANHFNCSQNSIYRRLYLIHDEVKE